VVADLLTHPQGNEFYWIPLPDDLRGATFHQALSRLKESHECLIVAISHGGQTYVTNPPAGERLADGDRLLVVAESAPKL
jgi:hypothetical protein